MKLKWTHSLKFRIIALCLVISLLMTGLLGILLYRELRDSYRRQSIETYRGQLRTMMANVDRDYMQILRFISWLSNDSEVQRFLNEDPTSPLRDWRRLRAYNTVQRQLLVAGFAEHLDKCLIVNYYGDTIILGAVTGATDDHMHLRSDARDEQQSGFTSVETSPFTYGKGRTVIPMSAQISPGWSAGQAGWADLFFSTELFTTQLAAYPQALQSYLVVAGQAYEISGNRAIETDAIADVLAQDAAMPHDGIAELAMKRRAETLHYLRADARSAPISFILLLPELQARISAGALRTLLLASALTMLFFVLLLFMLLQTINRPIRRINRQIEAIGQGAFTPSAALETPDELGDIGRGVNQLATSLEALIANELRIEREKKAYAYRALQNQIQPHFLHNTLNSIRWMAVIHRADGIVEMVTHLAAMLRRLAAFGDDLIPLGDELQFVRDYLVIQSYRYGEHYSVEFEIPDDALLDCLVIRFTLQPLVENAIYHGIGTQHPAGLVRIRATVEDGETLCLSVIDNGIGMDRETLERLKRFEAPQGDTLTNVGLANIQQRIQLEFGTRYGLDIESEPGRFTSIHMRLPLLCRDASDGAQSAMRPAHAQADVRSEEDDNASATTH